MSVIVKGIKMPDCCEHCYLEHFGICTPTRSTVSIPDLNKKLDNCPLVELPEHHGRLIDANYLMEHLYTCETNGRPMHIMELNERLACIDEVPTVIEAEGEGCQF